MRNRRVRIEGASYVFTVYWSAVTRGRVGRVESFARPDTCEFAGGLEAVHRLARGHGDRRLHVGHAGPTAAAMTMDDKTFSFGHSATAIQSSSLSVTS